MIKLEEPRDQGVEGSSFDRLTMPSIRYFQ
jgi:hypothetical protein